MLPAQHIRRRTQYTIPKKHSPPTAIPIHKSTGAGADGVGDGGAVVVSVTSITSLDQSMEGSIMDSSIDLSKVIKLADQGGGIDGGFKEGEMAVLNETRSVHMFVEAGQRPPCKLLSYLSGMYHVLP
tara:strand:+ start:101 stop:481 length:381 start_codon:yes stop_codon:yes gene_type:complete